MSHSTATVVQAELDVRKFAELYPTPNVIRAVELAAAGRITWVAVHELFTRSLGAALADVR